jgi:hypothetical protein
MADQVADARSALTKTSTNHYSASWIGQSGTQCTMEIISMYDIEHRIIEISTPAAVEESRPRFHS